MVGRVQGPFIGETSDFTGTASRPTSPKDLQASKDSLGLALSPVPMCMKSMKELSLQ